jgi:7-cyano-7-deazaguanine reductase
METLTMSDENPLGRATPFVDRYSPDLLFAIERTDARTLIGIGTVLPFCGFDTWNAWELTWLNAHDRPQAASVTIDVPAESPRIVESKSLKLYLHSFSGSSFASPREVARIIGKDLSHSVGCRVKVQLIDPTEALKAQITPLPGACLDDLPVSPPHGAVDSRHLRANESEVVDECVHSHLMMSHCPITNQPDWASVFIDYRGPRINHPGLLQYLLSYRQQQDFHETCVERIFIDILARCGPEDLQVLALYTRRGGIDINPFRSTEAGAKPPRLRSWRQ